MQYPGKMLGFMITVVILSGITFQAAGAESTEKLTNDDILKMDTLHYFHLTPDGTTLVYLITPGTDLTPPAYN